MFEKVSIVVLLTAYKRDYFSDQIKSLLSQSIPPDKIIILNNGTLNLAHLKRDFGEKISFINSELNTKFWGRFVIAKLFNTDYILILDDDIIPGNLWVANCLRLNKEKNCIVTGNGRFLDNIRGYGDNGFVDKDIKVAFGGHSWFFKKEYLKYFLTEDPITYDTGEDITFSAICKIKAGIETWVPAQKGETSSHKLNYSDDQYASFRQNNWDKVRTDICNHYIKLGWTL